MKTFLECQLGNPDKVIWDGVDVGANKNTSIGMEMEYNKLYTGMPEVLWGSKKVRDKVLASTELYEVRRPKNWLLALGVKDSILGKVEGSENTDYYQAQTPWQASTLYAEGDFVEATTLNGVVFECTSGGTSDSSEPSWDTTIGNTTSDNTVTWTARALLTEQVTMAHWNNGSMNYVSLTGYNLTADPIVYNSAKTTKYIKGTDWYYDARTGEVKQIPGGSIGNTEVLEIAYKYKPITYSQINISPALIKSKYSTFEVQYTDPHLGKSIIWVIYEAKSKGGIKAQMNPEDYMKFSLDDISCRKNAHRANYEYGYIYWQN